MRLLNQDLRYEDVATEESRALFLGAAPIAHEVLHTGTLLCRFVPRGAHATVCPWWILFRPFALSNSKIVPGLGDFLYQSGSRVDARGFLVEGPGVGITCMEPGSRLTLVQIIQSAYAWMGPTNPQRREPCGGSLALRGGEFRVWIPGLRADMLQPVPIPRELYVVAAQRQAVAGDSDEPGSDAQDAEAPLS